MKNSLKLIILFVLSFGILIGYAFASEDVSEKVPLKQVSLGNMVIDESQGYPEPQIVAKQTMKEEEREAVDTTRQRILLFGDSMSQLLALRLSDYANQNGHRLTCVTWNGSSTRNWANTDTLNIYLRKFQPTHIFICLGSNELYVKDMKKCKRRILSVLDKVGTIPTIWIGPPNWCQDNGINQLLQEVMGNKAYYPSYRLTLARQQDGRHPTPGASAIWMDKIVEWMNSGHSVHPIRLEKPIRKNAYYRQITIAMGGVKRKVVTHHRRDTLTVNPQELD